MFRRRATIIGEGLKVVGNITTDSSVEICGHLTGEVQCKSLIISRKACLEGAVTAERVTVDGRVEGPINAALVMLKSRAHVVGDIHHQSLSVKKGAYFEGRSVQAGKQKEPLPDRTEPLPEKPAKRQLRPVPDAGQDLAPAATMQARK